MLSRNSTLSLLAACLLASSAFAQTAESGGWAEQTQIVYDAGSRSVSRVNVRVWDPHPERNLDFNWEPAAGNWPGVDSTGAATGQGRLVWRVKGSANYDPETVYSTYSGGMRDGRPHGKGKLAYRSGESFEGEWSAGYMNGTGIHLDGAGNRYEGAFVNGAASGEGRYMARNGAIYRGGFRDGLRHGKGTMRLAGGTVYEGEWRNGVEIGSGRKGIVTDATLGGLLKAQTSGSHAEKAELSFVIDQRMTSRQDVQYQHLVRDEDVAIFPVTQEYNDAWNGGGTISDSDSTAFFNVDWQNDFAFVELNMETTDKSRVQLDSMALEVSSSDAYRKPMFTLDKHLGCVGLRPDFSLTNHGWGDVRNAKVTVQFTSPDKQGEASREFVQSIADFDQGTEISVLEPLREAGVDISALETERFSCPSREQMGVCRAQVFNKVNFGEVSDFVWGEDVIYTTATGRIDYEWADHKGELQQSSENFSTDISLAVVEVNDSLAECGDGGGPPGAALRYIDVPLPVGQSDYRIDLPLRGNKNLSENTTRLKIHSEMTSFHQFRAAMRFADGSVRYSKPVSLFYIKPRQPDYFNNASPSACYLDPAFGSSC